MKLMTPPMSRASTRVRPLCHVAPFIVHRPRMSPEPRERVPCCAAVVLSSRWPWPKGGKAPGPKLDFFPLCLTLSVYTCSCTCVYTCVGPGLQRLVEGTHSIMGKPQLYELSDASCPSSVSSPVTAWHAGARKHDAHRFCICYLLQPMPVIRSADWSFRFRKSPVHPALAQNTEISKGRLQPAHRSLPPRPVLDRH